MRSTFRMNINELSEDFVKSLKQIFKDKDIEITIREVDETEYLLSSTENKNRLLNAIDNVNKRENLRELSMDELNEKDRI